MALALFSITTISLTSLLILIILSGKQLFTRNLNLILALASGALLGEVFLHIIPEFSSLSSEVFSTIILLSVLSNYFVEIILNVRHCHNLEHHHEAETTKSSLRFRLIISDIVHNLLDGFTLFASFIISTELGIATTLAILLHEIPKEISSFAMLIEAGFTKTKAIKINLLTAIAGIVGVVVSKYANLSDYSEYLLAFVAGNFLYIAMTDILPELHLTESKKSGVLKLLAFSIGVAIMWFMK